MRLRRLLAAGLTAALLTLPSAALTLELDGQDRTAEAKVTLVRNTTYVSLRSVAAMLDKSARVTWENGAARVTTDKLTLTARPGDPYLQVNDRYIYIKEGVRAVDGSVMVALRPLAAAMGGLVTWDGGTQTAHLAAGDGIPEEAPYSDEDLYWLSRIISAESRGEPLAGQIAVGTVVLNRVESGQFPDTIYDVIFDSRWGGQFEPVRNGTVYDPPAQMSMIAAQLCLQGAREAEDSLYFLAPALTSNHWIMANRDYVETIGCHWFYR